MAGIRRCRAACSLLLLLATGVPVRAAEHNPPYRDAALPVETRVQDLLGRMTLEEKLWQLFMVPGDPAEGREKYRNGIFGLQFATAASGGGAAQQLLRFGSAGPAPALAERINAAQRFFIEETRLGIPIIPFDEALHGLVREGATAFPQAIGLAATWDPELMQRVAAAIARETRSRGIRQVLSPVVNVATDVRWGRVEECYGEDPLLASAMGTAFVREFESAGVITTLKHFVANHGEGGRDSYPIHHNRRLLEEVYFPPFRSCIDQGGARSLMIAYNSLDGRPCTANRDLLIRDLREAWGFRGLVVSDAGAVGGMNDLQGVSGDYEESAKAAFENGLDLLFQTTVDHFPLFFTRALQGGYIDSLVIDRAVARVLRAKFELGLFEQPYVAVEEAGRVNGMAAHRELARQAARESIVLLKNRNGLLPLSRAMGSIAVIGPEATAARLGGYSGPGNQPVSILEGLKARAGRSIQLRYARGCSREREEVAVIPERWLRAVPDPQEQRHDAALIGRPQAEDETGGHSGLAAAYWPNPDFAGAPAFARFDPQIDFNWTLFSPHPALAREWFSASWRGELIAPASGTVHLGLEGNDGFRLYVNDSLVIDNWQKGSWHRLLVPLQLRRNLRYPLRVEFCERTGSGRIRLVWDYGLANRDAEELAEAVRIARASDVALICAGIVEGEGHDRASLDLPGAQEELIRAVAATGTPVAVLLTGGSAVTMNAWIDQAGAVLTLWYPGEEGGHAVAQVLFGEYNPAGRLPITFPLSTGQLPLVYNHKPTGRLDYYHDLPGEPLFPFGHGLSYTRFAYSDLELIRRGGDTVAVRFTLRNSGNRAGDEVVQLYSRRPRSILARPVLALKHFKRLHLEAGEQRRVEMLLAARDFRELNEVLEPVLEPGAVEIMVGASAADIRLRGRLTFP
ncbi:MAG TPA: glycoside hydrolase family 3 C-terminal domain-containing protein [bacterium]|nr:glycoside hydrolase family 3 C-terminal domain-containing protein [bacterium]HPR88090.1 glycoside hydrolase family 3 C-terminal domain-containing protein [bacterium]